MAIDDWTCCTNPCDAAPCAGVGVRCTDGRRAPTLRWDKAKSIPSEIVARGSPRRRNSKSAVTMNFACTIEFNMHESKATLWHICMTGHCGFWAQRQRVTLRETTGRARSPPRVSVDEGWRALPHHTRPW
jgi:hypothetical protein